MASPGKVVRHAGANLARAARRLAGHAKLPREGGAWVVVRIHPALGEITGPRIPFGRDEVLSLLDVLEILEAAATDEKVDGVILRFEGSPGGWSRALSLRRAVDALREAGKPVVAYAESLEAESLLIASGATRIWLPEAGGVFLVGLRIESFFVRGLLEHVGAKPEVVSIGRYKSAGERFTRSSMSPEDREQLESLVDDLFDALVGGIASGRGLSPETVRDLVDRGPYAARAAVEAGLVDECLYPDEIEAALPGLVAGTPNASADAPREGGVHLVEGGMYHALRARDPGWRPLFTGLPRIAYVVARGAIHRGGGARGIASDSLRRLLERLRRDEDTRGVVLRIVSPGGEPTASDLLWRQVSVLSKDKPVVACMGDVAASGGYYVAAAADAVLAEAGTVTGSIGVVGGKVDLSDLYGRLGVHKDAIERGARAGMLTESRGFTAEERAVLRGEMKGLYDVFVDRVAEGRKLSVEAVERAAQGRVVSGARALSLGLVDALGGPLEALREVRRLAGIQPDQRVLVDIHPRLPHALGLRPLLRFFPRRMFFP